MWVIGLGALLVQAPVVVHLQVAENVAEPRARGLTERFVEEARRASGLEIKVHEGWACGDQGDCATKIQAQTGAAQVVLLRLFGGITTIGLVAESNGQLERVSLESESPRLWPSAIRRLVRRFWDVRDVRDEPLQVTPPPPDISKNQIAPVIEAPLPKPQMSFVGPWVFLSSGLALGVVSAVFWGTAQSSQSSLEDKLGAVDREGRIVGISFDAATGAYRSINLRRNLAVGSLGAMSASLVVAFVWWLVAR